MPAKAKPSPPYTAQVSGFESLFRALNDADVRYVVVGGVATVLHGYARLTADLDLVVDLRPEEAIKAIEVLDRAGYEPRVPVPAERFADPDSRAAWIREKNMQVFSLVDRAHPMRVVDLFVESPIEFDGLWDRSQLFELTSTTVRAASIEDLVAMKRAADRPQDRLDIEQLERIQNRKRGAD